MADKGEYFARMAIQAIHKDTDFEVGYKYTKGDTVKDSQWNFNVNHSFGNANGMPYKSVLLGKIDLLEAANKDLRTENNGVKTENVEGKAEVARLKQLLASKGI
ncbi:MAG: D52 family tumor protein [Acidaminococcaceae bacterium]|nr:D52 family tumor protein [Acidaminococcaceae bacterium]